MCGRFALYSSFAAIKKYFELLAELEYIENYNVCPGSHSAVVIRQNGENRLDLMHWGLIPFWAKDRKIGYKMFNSRAETIDSKASFKYAFKKRRCLVPVNGFYEWQIKTKRPYYFFLKDNNIFSLAGIWETWRDPEGQLIRSFSIITTESNKVMKNIHPRMPVILPQDKEKIWLLDDNTDSLKSLLVPYSGSNIAALPLPDKVNSGESNRLIKNI